MSDPIDVKFVAEKDGKPVHEYWSDGIQIPSLSEVIRPVSGYAGIKKEVMDNAKEFGDDVHVATRYYDEDDLDMDSLEPRVLKRLNGWIKFRKEFEFQPGLIERPLAHRINGMLFGMTPDRIGSWSGGYAVVEIKNTAEIMPSHALQTAAQHDFASDGGKVPTRRLVVQLKDDDYHIEEFKDRKDREIFCCLLAACHWKWQKGIKG